jgi:hypothetical protein
MRTNHDICSMLSLSAASALAVIALAPSGARAVLVGQSSIIGQLDYSDTFAVTGPPGSTPSLTNPRPSGYQGSNAFGAYNVENSYGNPQRTYTPQQLQFVTPANASNYGSTSGNVGDATGFVQGGTVDQSIGYGLRDHYVVQLDGRLPQYPGRFDIGTYANAGDALQQNGALNVFFRATGGGSAHVDVFENGTQTWSGIDLGQTDFNWHNYAVEFDKPGKRLKIYIDQVVRADLDLNTFGNGIYQNFPTGAVGFGCENLNGGFLTYYDNFQVGAAAVPEPCTLGAGCLGAAALFARRRRRRC